jgi:hypothetical protein
MSSNQITDTRAANRWKKLRHAYEYATAHIASKKGNIYAINRIDLVLISNFKGGNASIAEPMNQIDVKLIEYSAELSSIGKEFNKVKLQELEESELSKLCNFASRFLNLTLTERTRIDGFGPSYASALLNIYFPDLLPILDRRVLLAAGAPSIKLNSQKQVYNIEKHYPWLINYSYDQLKENKKLTMSQMDYELFSTKIPENLR